MEYTIFGEDMEELKYAHERVQAAEPGENIIHYQIMGRPFFADIEPGKVSDKALCELGMGLIIVITPPKYRVIVPGYEQAASAMEIIQHAKPGDNVVFLQEGSPDDAEGPFFLSDEAVADLDQCGFQIER